MQNARRTQARGFASLGVCFSAVDIQLDNLTQKRAACSSEVGPVHNRLPASPGRRRRTADARCPFEHALA